MTEKDANTSLKLPYEKPRLRCIPLAAEEVLAAACKSVYMAAGKNGHQCGIAPCSVPGAFGS